MESMSVDVAATAVVKAILQLSAALFNHCCCCSYWCRSMFDRPACVAFRRAMRVFVTVNVTSPLVPYGVTPRRLHASGSGCIRWQQRMRRTFASRVWIYFSDGQLISGAPTRPQCKHAQTPFLSPADRDAWRPCDSGYRRLA